MRGHRRFAAWSIGISLVGIVTISLAQRGTEGATQPSAEAFEPTKHRFVAGSAEGKAKLTPSDLQAGEVGEYKLIVTVGAGGIAPGGGLLVAHPKSWFTNPFPLWKTLQQETPEKPHYAGVASSREGSKLTMTIDQVNLVGKTERFARTMTIRVEGEALREGDEITVTLANTTSPYLAGQDEIEVAIDAKGDGQFRKIKKGAAYEVFAAAGEEMVLVGPSQAVVGKEVKLVLTALDRFQNRADVFAGPVIMKGIDGGITDERGFYYRETGLLRVLAGLNSPAQSDWGMMGLSAKNLGVRLLTFSAIGMAGYYAGPGVHIIDPLALGDPLLARLPARQDLEMRIGHFERLIPRGYERTLYHGQLMLETPGLGKYYEQLRMVVSGPIFDRERLRLVWHCNTGQIEPEFDPWQFRTPTSGDISPNILFHLPIDSISKPRPAKTAWNTPGNVPFYPHVNGVRVYLNELTRAGALDVSVGPGKSYQVTFLLGEERMGRVEIPESPFGDGSLVRLRINIPEPTLSKGYDSIWIMALPPEAVGGSLGHVLLLE